MIENEEIIGKTEYNSVSEKKLAANRLNAKLSTGPKTEVGKKHSRRNALKHGILISVLPIWNGLGAEDTSALEKLLHALRLNLDPVGELEELLIEQIATCFWKLRRSLATEAAVIRRSHYSAGAAEILDEIIAPERAEIKENLAIPSGPDLDRILRYEAAIQRQLAFALNQLERLQRARKGGEVPAPVSVQLSSAE
jgi:hypothetical protein